MVAQTPHHDINKRSSIKLKSNLYTIVWGIMGLKIGFSLEGDNYANTVTMFLTEPLIDWIYVDTITTYTIMLIKLTLLQLTLLYYQILLC